MGKVLRTEYRKGLAKRNERILNKYKELVNQGGDKTAVVEYLMGVHKLSSSSIYRIVNQ